MMWRAWVCGVALCVAVSPVISAAQDQAEATAPIFKRLKAPAPGTPPKIDVQIDPEEYFAYFNPAPRPDSSSTAAENGDTGGAKALPFPDFWSAVAPMGMPAGLADFQRALAAITAKQPRLQDMQGLADRFGGRIMGATVGTGVSPALALAVVAVESGGREKAVSSAGAVGLMQLIPATADRFGVEDPSDAGQNIRGGVSYLDWLMEEFSGDPVYALAAYNAGENAVKKFNGAPPYAETRAYVPRVLAAWQVARGLCITPPQLVSDGCVFRKGDVKHAG